MNGAIKLSVLSNVDESTSNQENQVRENIDDGGQILEIRNNTRNKTKPTIRKLQRTFWTQEEELAAITKYQKTKDQASMEIIYDNTYRLIWQEVKTLAKGRLELEEELFHEAWIDIINNGLPKYDPNLSRLSTYICLWARSAALRALAIKYHKRVIRIPAHGVTRLNLILKVKKELLDKGIEASPENIYTIIKENYNDLAYTKKITVKGINILLEANQSDSVSLDAPINEDTDRTLMDSFENDTAPDPVEEMSKSELNRAVQDILATLTPREEIVLALRFGFGSEDYEESTLQEVGSRFGLSKERVRQIEAAALRKLRHPTKKRALEGFLE